MNKELEEAIERIKRDIKTPLACGDITVVITDDLETVLNYIDNSISKEVIEKKVEATQEEYELLLEHQNGIESNRTKYLRGKIHMGQELLEGK